MSQIKVSLPDIGEGVTEGEMVKWLVNMGDQVEEDQAVAEVMTDKATVEVPSAKAGVVKELKVKEGDIIPIGGVLLILEETSSSAKPTQSTSKNLDSTNPSSLPQSSNFSSQTFSSSNSSKPERSEKTSSEVFPPAAHSRVLATPSTRRLAREMSVDINTLQGTGLAGRVTRQDVLSVSESSSIGENEALGALTPRSSLQNISPSSSTRSSQNVSQNLEGAKDLHSHLEIPKPSFQTLSSSKEERVSMRGIRKKIAENMQMAKQVVPHFTLMDEACVTELVKLRHQAKAVGERYGVKITYLPFIMKALIATCKEFPMFNASIDDSSQEIVYKKYFNLGFAADTPNGLMVPVIHDVDHKTLLQLSADISNLAHQARSGQLKLEEMRGATITITNIGSIGGNYATPIINHPEVAILGMYKINDKPVMIEGQYRPTQVMNFTITADHRLIDGAVAAHFLTSFIKKLENPSEFILHMV